MTTDLGRLPDGTGLSSATPIEPVPVSPLRASIPSAYAEVARYVPQGLRWQYEVSLRDGREYHQWALSGERGGVHVHAFASEWNHRFEWMGGIEGHSPIRQSEYGDGKPSHEHCWLLQGPCWHDGSSLQFSEQIADYLSLPGQMMSERDHRCVLRVMVDRYDLWLPTAQAIETRRAETSGSVEDESADPQGCAQDMSHD